jgi:PIN domain nuclease of toxin-antitoxin system
MTYLDTHVLIWLYLDPESIPPALRERLDREELYVSPMVALELQYLREVGRLAVDPGLFLENAYTVLGLSMDGENAGAAVLWARNFTWTRDPFDRLITAQADLAKAPLVTKDAAIRLNYPRAIWD